MESKVRGREEDNAREAATVKVAETTAVDLAGPASAAGTASFRI
jgi:hypothetical protein